MDESRKAFESWIKFHSDEDEMNGKLERANSGSNYADSITDICWMAWQASRAAIEIKLPEFYDYTDQDTTRAAAEKSAYNSALYDSQEAIRAAGIKVKE